MIKKTLIKFAQLVLSLFMMLCLLMQSAVSAVLAETTIQDTSRTLLATVQSDGGEMNYYYLEDCEQNDLDKASACIAKAWYSADKLSATNNKQNVTLMLYHDWASEPNLKTFIYSQPSDYGFSNGVPTVHGMMTLDLNGHSINRGIANNENDTREDGEVLKVAENGTLTIQDSDSTSQHYGYVDSANAVWFETTEVKWNSHPLYGGIIAGGASNNGAGGIHVCKNGTLKMEGGTIAGNVSSDHKTFSSNRGGGGVSVADTGAKLYMNGGAISYNRADGCFGGGVFIADGGGMVMTGGEVSYNTVSGDFYGGGVYNRSETNHSWTYLGKTVTGAFVMFSGIIMGNEAEYGAGVYQEKGNVRLNGGTICNNLANKDGGGVYANGSGSVNLNNCTGTGVHFDGATLSGNTAKGHGGGLFINTTYVELHSGTIVNNTAKNGQGSGVHVAYTDNAVFSGGKFIIQNNDGTNLWLYGDACLGTTLTLANGSTVFISKSGYDRNNKYSWIIKSSVVNHSAAYENFLRSDDEGFSVIYSTDNSTHTPRYVFEKSNAVSVNGTTYVPSASQDNGTTSKLVDTKTYELQRGTFQYKSSIDSEDTGSVYYYSDGLFSQDTTTYNTHLATMSMNLAMAAFQRPELGSDGSYVQSLKAKNVIDLYKNIGFGNVEVSYPEPAKKENTGNSDYTIGFSIAQKELAYADGTKNGKRVIAVAIRGANYSKEWGSNVSVNGTEKSTTGEAYGFSDAGRQVKDAVETYLGKLASVGIENEIWIVGFSRAGATANLAAKYLTDDHYNVCGYTFEAPQGGEVSNINSYDNIHNLVNAADLVPNVAPTIMGFKRYGVDVPVPSASFESADYNMNRIQTIRQLAAINPEIAFNDSFYHATANYVGLSLD